MMTPSEKLRWLADMRAEYLSMPEEKAKKEYWNLNDSDRAIYNQVATARQLARYLESGADEAWGWLPSWRWDDWAEIHK